MTPSVGKKAPSFQLPDETGKIHALKQYLGKWVVLYFYPKDDTPGCTVEACSFRDSFAKFKQAGGVILGISVDPVRRHAKFIEKFGLPFSLLSDDGKEVVARYGVWEKKKFMGREYMGTRRVSFLIDPKGRIRKMYDPVKPDGHAEEVLRDLKQLKKESL